MEYIKLKNQKDILKLGFQDENGNIIKDEKNREVYIQFDLGDIDLPLKYNKCVNLIEQSRNNLKTQMIIINKKENHKGKQLLSSNEVLKVKAFKQFYKDMENAMDLFLGEGGTKKFLNGRNPYFEMWDDISEAIEPYMDKMKLTVDDMEKRIKEKYKMVDSDVITNE
ncbi:MAG: hypothetical protein ACLSWT_05615 [Clostridia bacterium]